jgi:hypothetical protein
VVSFHVLLLIGDRVSAAPSSCSPDTHTPCQDAYLENSGEVLPKFYIRSEQNMETNPIYASSGGIRTYPHLLDDRNLLAYTGLLHYSLIHMLEDG